MIAEFDDLDEVDGLPRSLADPDSRARTHLANERTFLAWIRTAVTFMTLGLASAQFLDIEQVFGVHLNAYLALILVVGGIVLAVVARRRFVVATDLIERGISSFPASSINVVSRLLIIIGLLAIGLLVLIEVQR